MTVIHAAVPSSSWRQAQSHPAWPGSSWLELNSWSIHATPVTGMESLPRRTVPEALSRVKVR